MEHAALVNVQPRQLLKMEFKAKWVEAPILISLYPVRPFQNGFFFQILYISPPDQIAKGTIDVKFLDQTVKTMLRTKFSLGLFESMLYPLLVSWLPG